MKNRILFFVLLLAFASTVAAQEKYSTYSNDRFSFSIDYPELLKIQPPSDNDDGRTFLSADGQVEVRVWGQYNAESKTLDERYLMDLKGFSEKPSYMVLKRDWYVLSGTKEGKIFYEKTLVRRRGDTDIFFTFTVTYPAAMKTKFDPIVKRMADSFKFDPNPSDA
jgi:hypothetical protein